MSFYRSNTDLIEYYEDVMSGSNETEKVAIVDDYRLLKNIKDDPDSYEYHSTKFHCLRPPLGQNDSDYKESDLAARLYFSLEHRLLCLLKIFTCDVDTISCFKQNHHHISFLVLKSRPLHHTFLPVIKILLLLFLSRHCQIVLHHEM